jgi:VWFA-related protein
VGGLVAGLLSVLSTLSAGGPGPAPANTAQVTVTVRARQSGASPVVSADDVRVYEDNKGRPVVSWVAATAQSGALDLNILVDDSIGDNVGFQFKSLADFFQTLPAGTRVRVAYASNGGNRVVQDFTSDYRLAAKALRLPMGSSTAGGSIYESLADLLKNWPGDGNRRELLIISDGLDISQGSEQSQPAQNAALQRAIDLAQRTSVPIYAIFARGARSLEGDESLLMNGQGCLSRLTSETGGQSYFEETHTPVAFAPFLNQFANDLRNQYVLTFQPLPATKAGYHRLRVTTEVPRVHLAAPARVFIPPAE